VELCHSQAAPVLRFILLVFFFLLYSSLLLVFTLTPPLLFHAPLTLFLTPLGLLHLLVLAALVEVLHHHTDKHVEDKKADDEEEGDEIQQHPWVVVGYWLKQKAEKGLLG